MNNTRTEYAGLSWSAEDVQTLRPAWGIDRCEAWLAENQKHIRDRLCELGWEVMEDLLPRKSAEDRLADARQAGASWACAACGRQIHDAEPPRVCARCGAHDKFVEVPDED
jgi:rubrerythrin